jgi:pseudouridine-5'-phosphate glycosidase
VQAPGAKYGIVVSAEVARALRDGAPVVALESTIISHGMPYPQNLATAQEVEAVVREGALRFAYSGRTSVMTVQLWWTARVPGCF